MSLRAFKVLPRLRLLPEDVNRAKRLLPDTVTEPDTICVMKRESRLALFSLNAQRYLFDFRHRRNLIVLRAKKCNSKDNVRSPLGYHAVGGFVRQVV